MLNRIEQATSGSDNQKAFEEMCLYFTWLEAAEKTSSPWPYVRHIMEFPNMNHGIQKIVGIFLNEDPYLSKLNKVQGTVYDMKGESHKLTIGAHHEHAVECFLSYQDQAPQDILSIPEQIAGLYTHDFGKALSILLHSTSKHQSYYGSFIQPPLLRLLGVDEIHADLITAIYSCDLHGQYVQGKISYLELFKGILQHAKRFNVPVSQLNQLRILEEFTFFCDAGAYNPNVVKLDTMPIFAFGKDGIDISENFGLAKQRLDAFRCHFPYLMHKI